VFTGRLQSLLCDNCSFCSTLNTGSSTQKLHTTKSWFKNGPQPPLGHGLRRRPCLTLGKHGKNVPSLVSLHRNFPSQPIFCSKITLQPHSPPLNPASHSDRSRGEGLPPPHPPPPPTCRGLPARHSPRPFPCNRLIIMHLWSTAVGDQQRSTLARLEATTSPYL
jgi:hypothetical protein